MCQYCCLIFKLFCLLRILYYHVCSVGYGDICPGDISGEGRAFIVFLSLSGMGMFW